MAKRSSFGSIVRKRLSDITNSQSQTTKLSKQEQVLPPQMSPVTEDFVNQLIKEKMTLMKVIEERNKIIELSAMEVQNLKVNLQKLQMQNWNLAQSNSQMLAEVNLGRERMKALQHELLCRDALLKATHMEMEVKKEVEELNHRETNDNGEKSPSKQNRRRNARSQSMSPSTTCCQRVVVDKEKTENKRRCLRKQSAKFKTEEQEKSDKFYEINDASFIMVIQPPDTPMHESEEKKIASKRSSVGRPLRRAAEKVQTYKEVPINVKMRRD